MARRTTIAALAAPAAALVPAVRRRREAAAPRVEPVPEVVRSPASLPRPALWSEPQPGREPSGDPSGRVGGSEGDTGGPTSRHPAWVAVGLMVLGAVLCALGIVLWTWPPLVAGVVVGLAGAVVAGKARIMDDATDD